MSLIELDQEKRIQKKLRYIYDTTLDRGPKFDGSLNEINYYNLVCKAASQDLLFNISSNNVCMFNYVYENNDSILMLFSVPITSSNEKDKHISERIMDIIKQTEECFITLDYVNSKEVKDDKFIYITMVKNINKENGDI